jgi:hypothetical protein
MHRLCIRKGGERLFWSILTEGVLRRKTWDNMFNVRRQKDKNLNTKPGQWKESGCVPRHSESFFDNLMTTEKVIIVGTFRVMSSGMQGLYSSVSCSIRETFCKARLKNSRLTPMD